MGLSRSTTLALALTLGALFPPACKAPGTAPGREPPAAPGKAATKPTEPAPLSVVVVVAPELQRWARAALALFEAQPRKTSSGQVIRPYLVLLEDGEAATRIGSGELQADLWMPSASPALGWIEKAARPPSPVKLTGCAPVVTSPLVMALTRPRAESLGLIKDGLSWQSLGSLARASARGQKPGESPGLLVGYPHPAQSAVGLLAVDAMRRLELPAADAAEPPVAAGTPAGSNVLEEVERVIGRRTTQARSLVEALAETASPLSAVLVPQHLVTEHNRDRAGARVAVPAPTASSPAVPPAAGVPGELVALLPSDGTHQVDYPACQVEASWSTPARQQAASAVHAHLGTSTVQEMARVSFGLRPGRLAGVAPPGAPGEPLILAAPGADDLRASQLAFLRTRRPVDVVLLVDRSPSMAGRRLTSVREALPALVQSLGPGDRVAIWPFDEKLDQSRALLPAHETAGEGTAASAALHASLDRLQVGRGCALYDALAEGLKSSTTSSQPGTARAAVIVITDGRDTGSRTSMADLEALATRASARGVTLHAVALSSRVERVRMTRLARKGGGQLVRAEGAELAAALRRLARTL